MKQFCFYDRESGLIHEKVFVTDIAQGAAELATANAPPGHLPKEGRYDALSQRVNLETGAVEDYQPPQPSPDHEWDPQSKRWKLRPDVAARQAARAAALARIAELERAQARPMRELALDAQNSEARKRLEALEAEIAKLRAAVTP